MLIEAQCICMEAPGTLRLRLPGVRSRLAMEAPLAPGTLGLHLHGMHTMAR